MTRRIPISAILAPHGIYQREAREARGYRPCERSRFAVVRTDDAAPWRLIHVASGGALDSALPALPRKLTLADKLAVARAWEAASHLDWSGFDALPRVTMATRDPPEFPYPTPSQKAAVLELRRLAALALA